MNQDQFLDFLKGTPFADRIVASHTIPAREAKYAPYPARLKEQIVKSAQSLGAKELYIHQARAIELSLDQKNVVTVTPTASGKSLSFYIPIFQRKLENPNARALLIYPTKALAQDQLAAIDAFNLGCKTDFKIFTFDGDTPASARRKIMDAGDFVITNPDMLHAGILPHHTNWIKLFENLEFVVIDELHIYRGIFGSHVANVIRRLKRICAFYGKTPQFLGASATIGNPKEHAEKLVGESFALVDETGAPSGEKHVLFYNPPIVNKALGIRGSALKEGADFGEELLKNNIRTIFFCRSRLRVELLFSYLRDRIGPLRDKIRSYRGGYLPNERRKIEKELRESSILGVVSTNALELGVDIGMLDVSVSVGYPGSISSLLQQFGRAGRRGDTSISVVIGTSEGTDQFLMTHPTWITEGTAEEARIHPDNVLVVADHIKCAVYELPFGANEELPGFSSTQDVLEYLASHKVVLKSNDQYHWTTDVYPANTINLRTGPRENVAIIDVTQPGSEKVIGELDLFAAPTMLHQHAIYLHQGEQYYVDALLWEERQARVRKLPVDYYTDAQEKVQVKVLEDSLLAQTSMFGLYQGELSLTIKAVMFKKIKLETHENLGWGDIHTPELEMHTQGCWILLEDVSSIKSSGEELGAILWSVTYALSMIAPLYVLCDKADLRFRAEVKHATFGKSAIYFYDSIPGGIGISYAVLSNLIPIARGAKELVSSCSCEKGCPSCIGALEEGLNYKKMAADFLERIVSLAEQMNTAPSALPKA